MVLSVVASDPIELELRICVARTEQGDAGTEPICVARTEPTEGDAGTEPIKGVAGTEPKGVAGTEPTPKGVAGTEPTEGVAGERVAQSLRLCRWIARPSSSIARFS